MMPKASLAPCLLALAFASCADASAFPFPFGADEEEAQHHRSLRGLSVYVDPKSVSHKAPYIASDAQQAPQQEQCCVPCTTPANACCLKCSETSSYRERDLLMASMEGLTTHLMEKHAGAHDFLKTRAWAGNSHIGNRPLQATYYYDWIRSALGGNVKHVCEIGMNGGHSAVIFLAGLAGREGVRLTMWDLLMWDYSDTAAGYVEKLYPGKMTVVPGNSRRKVPEWTKDHLDDLCDVFSVDGGHRYFEARADIINAVKATKKGGIILLDDMNPKSDTRRAFDNAVNDGLMANPRCVENVRQRVGYDNRVDESNSREMVMSWCMATVV
jgi:predicted O-methyltransferase YrrM